MMSRFNFLIKIVVLIGFWQGYSLAFANSEGKEACDLWVDLPTAREKELLKLKEELINELSNMRAFSKAADSLYDKAGARGKEGGDSPRDKWALKQPKVETNQDAIQLWRKQFFVGILLPGYAHLKEFEKLLIEDRLKRVSEKLFTKEIKAWFSARFLEAKSLAKNYLSKRNFDPESKKFLLKLIDEMKIEWFERLEGSSYESNPMLLLDGDIEYQLFQNVMIVGLRSYRFENEDSVVALFAEKMAHAFDPCRWSVLFPDKANPFESVLKCLRDPHSIGARERERAKLETKWAQDTFSKETLTFLKTFPYCNTAEFPQEKDQREQVNHAFADWFSAEILALKPKLSTKTREELCSETFAAEFLPRAGGTTRLVRIYLANPKVRKKMGYKIAEDIIYCDWKK